MLQCIRSIAVGVIVLAVAAAPAPAANDVPKIGMSHPMQQIEHWYVGYDQQLKGCVAAGVFEDDTVMWIGFLTEFYVQPSMFVAFVNSKWNVREGGRYRFEVKFYYQGTRWWRIKGHHDAGSNSPYRFSGVHIYNRATNQILDGGYFSTIDSDTLEYIARANSAALYMNKRSVARYTMKHTRQVINSLTACQNNAPTLAARIEEQARQAQQPNERATHEEGIRHGTGFFVSEAGHVLTNNHVTENCTRLQIRASDGMEYEARITKSDSSNDLALLLSNATPKAVAEFEYSTNLGERVFIFGYPLTGFLSSSGTFTDGSVSSLEGIGDDSRMIQMSAPVQPGNSGGALLNEKGAVVGIVTSKADAISIASVTQDITQNVNFAVKSSIALSFLQGTDLKPKLATATEERRGSDIAALGKSMSVKIICGTGPKSDGTAVAGYTMVVPPPSATTPTPPPSDYRSFAVFEDADMEGGDYLTLPKTSQSNCDRRCSDDGRCRAYSYDRWNRFCFLKSEIRMLRHDPRYVTKADRSIQPAFDRSPLTVTKRRKKAFRDKPYNSVKVRSFDQCSQTCMADSRCQAFNFFRTGRICNLIDAPSEYFDNQRADIGIKLQEP